MTLTDLGTLTGGTVVNGGLEVVSSGGVAIATTVAGGGQQVVSSGGATNSTTVTSGGLQIVSGGGTTSATTLSGGVENVLSGGTASGTTIAGGIEDVLSGGSAVGITFGGTVGTLELARPQGLSGTISSWQVGDILDFVSTTVTSAAIIGSTLSVTVSGGGTFNYQLANQQINTVPIVISDGNGGSDVELTINGPDIGELLGAGPIGALNKTNFTTPVFKGAATPNSTIQLFDGTTLVGTGTSNAQGIWTITANALTPGTNLMKAVATDTFNNVTNSAVATVIEFSGTTFSGATQTQNVNFQANNANNTFSWGDGVGVVIAGNGTNVVSAGNGRDTVVLGDGTSNSITLGNGNDAVTIGNGQRNTITLGNGNDTVTIGTGSRNAVFLGNGNDTLVAGSGDNNIALGNGRDIVTVGGGNNIIVLGGGASIVTTGSGHPDEIVLTSPNALLTMSAYVSNDQLVFRNAGFDLGVDNGKANGAFGFDNLKPPSPIDASLLSPNTNGTFATTANRFAYDQSTGKLFYDSQGSTSGSIVHEVADLTNKPPLTAANLFFTN